MTDASDKEMRILDSFSLNESKRPELRQRSVVEVAWKPTACILQLELEDGALSKTGRFVTSFASSA
jgi:hypothetical protein